MWVEVRTVSGLMLAEMWKELFEGEGIPTRILPDTSNPGVGEFGSYKILVPREKEHIIQEIMRKL